MNDGRPDWQAFWSSRWDAGQIGFHREAPQPHLVAHFDAAFPAPSGRILVPLCGKSVDLAWLEDRFPSVVGVEFVARAAHDFAAARSFAAATRPGPLPATTTVTSGRVDIHVADFLALTPATVGTFEAAYDRAALIALPPEVRVSYASRLIDLLAPQATALILTFAYPQDLHPGPPFSVPDTEVEALFGPHGTLTRLATETVSDVPAALAAARVTTSVFRFVRT